MRILYLTNGFPFPLTSAIPAPLFFDQGAVAAARDHAALDRGRSFRRRARRQPWEPYTERVLTFLSSNKSGSLKQKAISRVRSLAQADSAVQQMSAAIVELTKASDYDAVLFSGKRTYPAIKYLTSMPLVVDMCDATSMKIRGSMRRTRLARLPLVMLDYVQVRSRAGP